jgi:acetyltransferase-like isoleucine patch superfamily enzyme
MPVEGCQIGEGTVIHHPELSNIYNAKIGKECRFGAFVDIGPCEIGDWCNIQARAFIPQGVILRNRVFIGPGVIFTNDKYPPSGGGWKGYPPTEVKNGASIGAGAIILPGVTIGICAKIGAGSIVTKDVGDGEEWILNGLYRKSSSTVNSSTGPKCQPWRRRWRPTSA